MATAQLSKIVPTLNRSNTEVYVRIRPELHDNLEYYKILNDNKSIYIRYWQDFAKGKTDPIASYHLFETNGILYNVSQSQVFDTVTGNGLFDSLIYGNNAVLMSYGQTGSGKTLTTSGLCSTYEDRGLLPRIFESLFELKSQQHEKYKLCIKFRYVETNRNQMVNLLSDDDIIYDMNNYEKIKPVKVNDLDEAFKMIFKAEARKTFRLKDNYKSNIANSIATFSIYSRGHSTAVCEGTLHLVDMAGIDTIGNSSCDHKTGYEVGNGNLVKSQIEQLIIVINENFSKSAELKQRLCIVNKYLRQVLNANSIIRVIAHVRVQRDDIKLCTSMLRMGCSIKGMVPKKLFRFVETSLDVQYHIVTDELKALKKELDLNAMLCNEDMSYNLSDERLSHIERLALEYLEGESNELVLLSTTDTVLTMRVIKNLYNKIIEKNSKLASRINLQEQDQIVLRPIKNFEAGSVSSKTSRKNYSSIDMATTFRRPGGKKLGSTRFTAKSKAGKTPTTADAGNETISHHSFRSRATSSKFNRKRHKSPSEKMDFIDVDNSLDVIPEDIPSYSTAWNLYIKDQGVKMSDLTYNLNGINAELEVLTKNYNKEVLALEELNTIASLRKKELNHAILIKDIDTNPQTLEDLHEFQRQCIELSNTANKNVIDQKEKILKLQTEIRLNIDYKNKVIMDISKKFNDYCLQHFKVLIPGTPVDSTEILTEGILDVVEIGANDRHTIEKYSIPNIEPIWNDKTDLFNKLRQHMLREINRIEREKLHKKKWISSFK